jgi:beta-galactosidase
MTNATSAGTARRRPLNRGWRYGGPAVAGATDRDFDDSRFARVTIPHTNKLVPWHSFDDRDYQFVSTYRRPLRLPAAAGKRLFLDFDGVMTAVRVFFDGVLVGEHTGGYTPFSCEITGVAGSQGEHVIAVEVDSTERADIPPFGGRIDYLTFGGIYRDVWLRVVPPTFVENVFAKPVDVLAGTRRLDVRTFVEGPVDGAEFGVEVLLRDGQSVLASAEQGLSAATLHTTPALPLGAGATLPARRCVDVSLPAPASITLWDLDAPKRYTVSVRLRRDGQIVDEYETRIGFRDAQFTQQGFLLNGRQVKLRGLNRHQTFPWVGQAMPARVQRRDALILKRDYKCNVVRTSHYPQSPHFLDACDEIGLLVFEEIPGWQHIGDEAWKAVACRNVEEMIRRDWNHPSIILWGVRINESRDDHDFYTRSNAIAHALDDSRQTGGVRNRYESERLEDVFTMNDFNPHDLREPNHPRYLNTEFCGHMFPTKQADNVERVQEHVRRHAHIHHLLAGDDQYAGGIGWCAFDYNTHADFGSGDRICYHGVGDIFRIAKPAAGLYRSQCDPAEEVVLEPAFHWAIGDQSEGGGPRPVMICSNCDRLELYVGGEHKASLEPDRTRFGNLAHPPFFADRLPAVWGAAWQDLRIDGYLGDQRVISRTMSAAGVDRRFVVEADDAELMGDGSDATRVVFRVTDEHGNARPFATGAIAFTVEGPGELVGDNPFALAGGAGAIWVKATEAPGTIRLTARHPQLGEQRVTIAVAAAAPEEC